MKFSTIFALAAVSVVQAADADADFLTNLVNDYKDHTKDYAAFIRTAKSIPGVLTSLAVEVATYTDDSYTTMLEDNNLDVSSLEAFATELPWYSRLKAGDSGSGTAEEESSTSASSDSEETSSAEDSVASLTAPMGAILGAVVVALL